MWSGWPAAGAPVALDVGDPSVTGLADLPSRVREVLDDGIRVTPPRVGAAAGGDLTGATVTVRWQDPYRGLCSLPSVVAWCDLSDRFSPWRLVVTGDTAYVQRRAFVREQVPGRVVCTAKTVANPEGLSYAVTGRRDLAGNEPGWDVVGVIGDLSEGGVRLVTTEYPKFPIGRDVRVVIEFEDGSSPVEASGQVVRVVGTRGSWEVAVMLPDPHPQMDRLRSLVFAEQRRRLKSVLGRP